MAWITHDTYCVEEHLHHLNIPHCITTKRAGNMKHDATRTSFFSQLKNTTDSIVHPLATNHFFSGIQVHSTTCQEVRKGETISVFDRVDALYTSEPTHTLGVFTADCMPVFIVDPTHNAVALVHAGWRGIAQNIVLSVLAALHTAYATSPRDVLIVCGPHLKSCCYEVTDEMSQHFSLNEKKVRSTKKYFLDLEQYLVQQLVHLGIPKHNIVQSTLCTGCNRDLFFSYRCDDKTEQRMLSLIAPKL